MADYFEWQDSYSVGVQVFDDAHKDLIGIINRVVTACMENKPLNQMTDLLIDLIRYTRYHFRD
ncbi:MAG: hemerythrin, partial [bacterium]